MLGAATEFCEARHSTDMSIITFPAYEIMEIKVYREFRRGVQKCIRICVYRFQAKIKHKWNSGFQKSSFPCFSCAVSFPVLPFPFSAFENLSKIRRFLDVTIRTLKWSLKSYKIM